MSTETENRPEQRNNQTDMGFIKAMLRNKTDNELILYASSQQWLSPLEAELLNRWEATLDEIEP